MGYSVRTVDNRATLKDFLRLPFKVYEGDQNWIPPINSEVRRTLDPRKNPYFVHGSVRLFICYDGKEPVARVAIVINRDHWEKFGVRSAFFGFFESINDQDAVAALMKSVYEYCAVNTVQVLEGPFNPHHYSEIGFLVNKFDFSAAFFQSYNPSYYVNLLQSIGFTVSKRIHTRKNERIREYVMDRYPDALSSHYEYGDYVVRSFRMNDLKNELEKVRSVFNDAFSNNWNFIPLSRDEYLFSAKFLSLVTYPDLITIVERNGEPVGVLECVLDINPLLKRLNGKIGPIKYLNYQRDRKKLRNLIVYAVGIKRAYQRTRVHKLLFDSLCRMAIQYNTLETTWVSEDNVLSIRAAEHFGMIPDKEFVVMQKEL